MLLITLGMLALGYVFWNYWEQPTSEQIRAVQTETDSLQAIIDKAQQDLSLKPAQQQAMRFLSDTLGALLEAQFAIRTFVKAAAPPPPPPGQKPAKVGGASP